MKNSIEDKGQMYFMAYSALITFLLSGVMLLVESVRDNLTLFPLYVLGVAILLVGYANLAKPTNEK